MPERKHPADDAIDAVNAHITQKQRDKVSDEDFGDPAERKYPVRDQKDLDAAVKLVGRAPKSKQAKIKQNLKRIAERKGLKLPKSWSE
jgi:uncharacterized phage protein gp47/JayE